MDVNQIFFLGHNKYGQAGIGEQQHNRKYPQPKQIVFKTFIKQVSCGNHHSALLTIDGLIYTMGSNIHGTLGLGNTGNINYAFKPTLVKDLKDVDQVFSGSYHMCALKQGELYTWGKGIDGQLGHGNMKNVFAPTKVQALGNDVESVSCGLNHTLVKLNKNGNNMNGYSFGSGIYGQLGNGSNRSSNFPVNIKLSNIESVCAGQNHSLFLSQEKVYGCGDNSCFQMGQLQDSMKSKKYILEPIRLEICDKQVSLIDCHNLSVALTSTGKAFVWGGSFKLWPPIQIDEYEVLNVKVSNQKLFYINANNQMIDLSFTGPTISNQKRQVILSSRNILDFDAGQNHLLAVGDIVAQTQDKMESSFLSIWKGQSLTSSKETFSQKSINLKNQNSSPNIYHENQNSVNKQMPQFYFTMHLKSGMSQEQSESKQENTQKRESSFQSAHSSAQQESMRYESSNQTFKTFENMSSSIEMQSRSPFDINESETKKYFQNQDLTKVRNLIQTNEIPSNHFIAKNKISEPQNKNPSETKLQKLMDEMESKTIHLKKNYPLLSNNIERKSQKSITKTPSSYIKKQPEKFMLESQQANQYNDLIQDPKISQFDYSLQIGSTLKEINSLNATAISNQQKDQFQQKKKTKSVICFEDKQNMSEERQKQTKRSFKDSNQQKTKEQSLSIQTIFKQLLKKQHKQKIPDQVISKVSDMSNDIQELPQRRQRLSHSCISSKQPDPSTVHVQKLSLECSFMPALVPINRSPAQQNKMAVSKISEHSDISGKRNFERNNDLREISRSNRELRSELRERDFKISQLQDNLSRKEIEIQMLYKQLQYFKHLTLACQQCGNQTMIQDPFASV